MQGALCHPSAGPFANRMAGQRGDTDDSAQLNKASISQPVMHPPYHWSCNIHSQELSGGITSNASFETGVLWAQYWEVTDLELNAMNWKHFNLRTLRR